MEATVVAEPGGDVDAPTTVGEELLRIALALSECGAAVGRMRDLHKHAPTLAILVGGRVMVELERTFLELREAVISMEMVA
jgi:hypothetical protein